MNPAVVLLIIGSYMALLFFIASWAQEKGRVLLSKYRGYLYGLGVAVYCSAWTFYGSIGRAATSGLDFLAIYIGPTLIIPLWWFVTKKTIRISKKHYLNTLSDFLVARYGKNRALGMFVTGLVLMAITPYIALQIKAIASSAAVLLGQQQFRFIDLDVISTVVLFVFTMSYGMRYAFDENKRLGFITAIGFESVVKLLAAFIGGFLIVNTFLGGSAAVYKSAFDAGFGELMTIRQPRDWFWLSAISALAFVLLPRQFHMSVTSNEDEAHVKKAMWMVPLYLLLINWWVLPVALGGNLQFGQHNADYHFLNLAIATGSEGLQSLIFLGGFAASTSMIIVSATALGNMLSNNILFPMRIYKQKTALTPTNLMRLRRLSIALVFVLAYMYYKFFVHHESLVSIGIISFLGISQLAPGFFAALFWKRANVKGVVAGLVVGFGLWAIAFALPQWGAIERQEELWLFNMFSNWNGTSNIAFISLFANTLVMAGVSLFTKQGIIDQNQGALFLNILKISKSKFGQATLVQGEITYGRLETVLKRYMSAVWVEEQLSRKYIIERIKAQPDAVADPAIIGFAELLLTESIGPASARIVLAKEITDEAFNRFDVLDIIQESREVRLLNSELNKRTTSLRKATEELEQANAQLQELSNIKDDFLYTVTHELRSPLTAIRAQSELLLEMDDMPLEDRKRFMSSTVEECERLTNLISNILDIEKFESGNQQLEFTDVDLVDLVESLIQGYQHLAAQENITLTVSGTGKGQTVHADSSRIKQVFVNLLSNAIKHAKSQVSIEVNYNMNTFRVNVVDDGQGIRPSDESHLFEKFFQSRDQTIKKRKGTGLGLAISSNIIKAHGGLIWLDQNPPAGPTTFSFTLPKNPQS